MPRHFLFAWLLVVALAWPAQAEQLFRCVGPGAAVSYQSMPCTGAAKLDRVVDYRPDPVVAPARTQLRPLPVRAHPVRPSPIRIIGQAQRYRVAATAADHCRTARAKREAALERLGLKRTYAQLSRWDASVRAACD